MGMLTSYFFSDSSLAKQNEIRMKFSGVANLLPVHAFVLHPINSNFELSPWPLTISYPCHRPTAEPKIMPWGFSLAGAKL